MNPSPLKHSVSAERASSEPQLVASQSIQDALDAPQVTQLEHFITELGGLEYAIKNTERDYNDIAIEASHRIKLLSSPLPIVEKAAIVPNFIEDLSQQYEDMKRLFLAERTAGCNAFLQSYGGTCYVRLEDGGYAPLVGMHFPEGVPQGIIEHNGEEAHYSWQQRHGVPENNYVEVDIMQLPLDAQDTISSYLANL